MQALREESAKEAELRAHMTEEAHAKYMKERDAKMSDETIRRKQQAEVETRRNVNVAAHLKSREDKELRYGKDIHSQKVAARESSLQREARTAQLHSKRAQLKAAELVKRINEDRANWELELKRVENEQAREQQRAQRELERCPFYALDTC